MAGGQMSSLPGGLPLTGRRGRWWRLSWSFAVQRSPQELGEAQRRQRLMLHLGRGRRAREAGRFEVAVREARRALAISPSNAWVLALLGQCLSRQQTPDLAGARSALERATSIDPANGYFVRLLLGVLEAQGDGEARTNVLHWAWWSGAPVERWIPGGPPVRPSVQKADDGGSANEAAEPTTSPVQTLREARDADAPLAPTRLGSEPVHA